MSKSKQTFGFLNVVVRGGAAPWEGGGGGEEETGGGAKGGGAGLASGVGRGAEDAALSEVSVGKKVLIRGCLFSLGAGGSRCTSSPSGNMTIGYKQDGGGVEVSGWDIVAG